MQQLYNLSPFCDINKSFGEGKIIYSKMQSYYRPLQESSLSIKLVLEGSETYFLNGKQEIVKAGQFLLVNNQSAVEINYNNKQEAKGLCFYPPINLVNSIFETNTSSTKSLLEQPTQHKTNSHFTEKIYSISENKLGAFLQKQVPKILLQESQKKPFWLEHFHLNLALNLVESQEDIHQKVSRLNAIKATTKEELFRRVSTVYQYIESEFKNKLSIEQLTQIAYLSPYHLIRSYKAIYGCTPYQHILQKRLDLAHILLKKGQHSMQEITFETGFSDVKNLQKALKK